MFNVLLSVSARIAKMLSVGFHIMESHKVMNIQKMIMEFASDRKIISVRIFLFSVLFMLEKNIDKHIRVANKSQTKWKLKFWGLKIVSNCDNECGKYIPDSNEKAV